MSTYFIFNSQSVIDEKAIEQLQLTTTLSKNILVQQNQKAQNNLQNDESISFYTPKFLWVLRDFNLELKDEQNRNITANQYMENALYDEVFLPYNVIKIKIIIFKRRHRASPPTWTRK